MPIYPGRREGTWRVTVYSASLGRQKEQIVEGRKSDAKRVEREMEAELARKPIAVSRAAPRFGAFCEEKYEPHARRALKASSWKARVYQLADLVEFFGDVRLDKFSDALVEEYKAECTDRGRHPGYTNGLLRVLSTVTRWARDDCKLPVPPLKIQPLKPGKRRVRAWTLDEVRRLYAAAPEWWRDVLHFLLDTGCRKGELIAALWSWVDLDARLLRIPATDEWQPKDGEARDVPISDGLMAMLRRRGRTHAHIFTNQFGVPYQYFPHSTYWAARDAAGLTGGIHQSRHTFASHFLMAQPDLALLAQVMGHSTTYVTELYAHLLPEHLHRARNAVQLSPPSGNWAKTMAPTMAAGSDPVGSLRKS